MMQSAAGQKIMVKGAYYLQSHLTKSEGGGGHEH
jgi:cobalt-zinc-cadmium efflux system membrane fusion protein